MPGRHARLRLRASLSYADPMKRRTLWLFVGLEIFYLLFW
jgi:hypothetical protein